jgi:hypothetical protein
LEGCILSRPSFLHLTLQYSIYPYFFSHSFAYPKHSHFISVINIISIMEAAATPRQSGLGDMPAELIDGIVQYLLIRPTTNLALSTETDSGKLHDLSIVFDESALQTLLSLNFGFHEATKRIYSTFPLLRGPYHIHGAPWLLIKHAAISKVLVSIKTSDTSKWRSIV